MRVPSILAQFLPELLLPHDRTSHAGVTIVPEKDLHLSSPAVKIILSKAAQPYKYVAENVDFYGINIYKAESVSLEEAARLLLKDGHKSSKYRRLYEVANVLCAINLMEKIGQQATRKPIFRLMRTSGPEANRVTPAEQSHKRLFRTDITNADKKRVKVEFNFGPFSPDNLRALGYLKAP